MINMQPLITVFTPTYNRAYMIDTLYQSLKKQTFNNFEWIVIDDGSKDDTKELFSKWMKETNNFNITYIKVDNGGKHRAINKGITIAKGKLFFIVDSDDYLTDDALEKIKSWEEDLPKDKKYAGIAGAKGFNKTNIIGKGFLDEYLDLTSQERYNKKIIGDKAEVFYTDILKKFPFPVFDEENFITESVVWFAIGKAGYRIRWYNDIIYIANYLNDGLTNSGNALFRRNPKGYLLSMKSDLDNIDMSYIKKMGYYANFYETAIQIGLTKDFVTRELNINSYIITVSCLLRQIKNKLMRIKN